MAECCTMARCSQERRLFRRELQKWSKELLYIMGLERLAEELMGVHHWKILSKPFTDLEDPNPSDWSPEETCFVCNAKKLPPYDPASGILSVFDGCKTLRIDTDDHSVSSDQGAAPVSSTPKSGSLPILEQPLDLSVATLRQPTVELISSVPGTTKNSTILCDGESPKSVLKVPQISLKPGQKKRVDNSKRSYTEEELQAALRDIQSGKLGTRRAAVMYGIPRSTLRNKVYKLANESKSRAHCRLVQGSAKAKIVNKTVKLSPPSEECVDNEPPNNHNVSSAGESLRQLLKHTIARKALGIPKSFPGQSGVSSDQTINEHAENNGSEATESSKMLGTLECSDALGPVLAEMFRNIHQIALGKYKENLYSSNQPLSALKDDMKLPILPDLIRRLAEERVEVERDYHKSGEYAEDNMLYENVNSYESSNNVILKVPSFKAAKYSLCGKTEDTSSLVSTSSSDTSSQAFSKSNEFTSPTKDIISKDITQIKAHSSDLSSIRNLAKFSCLPNNEKYIGAEAWVPSGTSKQHSKELGHLNLVECSKPEKRARPKRGRYRNYDRDNLARAVYAVRKGEMSVHRAGTFFGVPHSTLEYKVKERHLLRPRKKDTFLNTHTDATEPVSVSKDVSIHPKENQNCKLSESHNGLKYHPEENHRPSFCSFPSQFSLWQSLPLYSLDSSEFGSGNFFASQMMRKLQENAILQGKEQEKKTDLGILETLIKSTLDRPMSPVSRGSLPRLRADSVTEISKSCGETSVRE